MQKKKNIPLLFRKRKMESFVVVTGLWTTAYTSGSACLPWLASRGGVEGFLVHSSLWTPVRWSRWNTSPLYLL